MVQMRAVQCKAVGTPKTLARAPSPPPALKLHQRIAAVGVGVVAAGLLSAGPAAAFREKVGSFGASGFLFKDTVVVQAFDDPEVAGVTLYLSDIERSLSDKLAKDFFSDPSQTSVTCAATGPVSVSDLSRISGTDGNEVFSERKGLGLIKNKATRVRRVYDEDRRTLIYVAYSTRTTSASDEGGPSGGRYKTSLCALPVPQLSAPSPAS